MKVTLTPVEILTKDGIYLPLIGEKDYSDLTAYFDLIIPENF